MTSGETDHTPDTNADNGATSMETTPDIPLAGWDISSADDTDWIPWGANGDARARILAVADGYHVVLVEAEPGYSGEPHEHEFAEFLYVLDGELRNQGRTMTAGGAYAAASGSQHTDFVTAGGARYVTVFRI